MASQAVVEVVADLSGVEDDVERGMDRAIQAVTRSLDPVEVDAEVDPDAISDLARRLTRDLQGIERSLEGVDVRVAVDQTTVDTARERLRTLESQLESINVDVDVDVDSLAVERARASLRRLSEQLPDVEVDVEVDVDRDSIFGPIEAPARQAGGLAADLFSGSFRSAMSTPQGAGVIVAGVTAALATIGPAVAALGIGAGVAAIAFSGFAGALDNLIKGETEKFKESFASLSDAAQSVFGELQESLLPVLSSLRDNIETAFFTPLQGRLTQLAPAIEKLTPAFEEVANAMGILFDEILAQLSSPNGIRDLESILKSTAQIIVLITPLIAGALVGAVKALNFTVQAGVLIYTSLRDIFRAISNTIQTVIGWFNQAGVRIQSFGGIVSGLAGIAVRAFQSFRNAVNTGIAAAAERIQRFPGQVYSFLSGLAGRLFSIASSAFGRFRDAVSQRISDILAAVRRIPGQVRSALGNLGSLLYNSGRALIGGFVSGIRSRGQDAINAAKSIASRVRDFFPFSPAKEGPFSGRGYTTFSGQALIEDWVKGMQSRFPEVQRALQRAIGIAQIQLAPAGATPAAATAGTPAQAIASGIGMGAPAGGLPSIQVLIGNRVINDHIDVRIRDNNQRRDRLGAQGIRR